MSVQTYVTGLASIYTGTSGSSDSPTLELLGYTRDGVEPQSQGFYLDVKSDENGGEAGPPVEVQFMGETARVRLELPRFDPAVAQRVQARTFGSTAGTPAAAGSLMFASSLTVPMKISCPGTSAGRLYGRCFVRDAITIGFGTKHSTLVVEFECHKDSNGVVYTSST